MTLARHNETNQMVFWISSTTTPTVAHAVYMPNGIPIDSLFHIWIVRLTNNGSSGFTLELYLDTLNNKVTANRTFVLPSTTFTTNYIGTHSTDTSSPNLYFNGDIGELMIYPETFDDTRVSDMYNKLVNKWEIPWLRFDQKVLNSGYNAFNNPVVNTHTNGLQYTSFSRTSLQYIQYNNSITMFDNNRGMTLFFVGRFTGTTGDGDRVFHSFNTTSTYYIVMARSSTTNTMSFWVSINSTTYTVNLTNGIPTDSLFHIWIVRLINNGISGFTLELYLDTLINKVTTTHNLTLSGSTFNTNYIGRHATTLASSTCFNGDIGELLIYPETLNDSRLSDVYNKLLSKWDLPFVTFDQKVLNNDYIAYNNPVVNTHTNGLQYTSFDRASLQYIQYNNPITMFDNNKGMTAFFVGRFTSIGNNERVFNIKATANSYEITLSRNLTTNHIQISLFNISWYTLLLPNGIPTDGSFHVWIARLFNNGSSGCTAELYMDSLTNKVTTTHNLTLPISTFDTNMIGRHPTLTTSSYYFNGDIGELLIYPETLNDSSLSDVYNKLLSKWEIPFVTFDQKVLHSDYIAYNNPVVNTLTNRLQYTSFDRAFFQYIKYNNPITMFDNNRGMTAFFVGRFTLFGSDEQVFNFKATTTPQVEMFMSRNGDKNQITFSIYTSSTTYTVNMTNGIPVDSSFHIWVVRLLNNGTSFTSELYLDSLTNKVTTSHNFILPTTTFTNNFIARHSTNTYSTFYFNGDICELLIYPETFDDTRLTDMYNKLVSKWLS